jgi:uncharacterized protein (DUF885 family)
MSGYSHSLWCTLALLALAACGKAPIQSALPAASTSAPPEQLARIVERYWDERISQDNAISPQLLADSLNIERRYLAEVVALPAEHLDANSRLTYQIFKKQRELAIEGFTFPAELLPMNPFFGMSQQFAAAAAAMEQRPLASVADCESWLRRTDEYVRWTQQAIINMRDGVRRGYTSPRALIERMLPILERLGADDPANVFYTPLRTMQESMGDAERTRLSKLISSSISQKVLPANRALHDFLQHEYLPRTRAGIALSGLPLGSQWYEYRIRRATGSVLSADEIHRLGIAEVERIVARRQPTENAPPAAAPLAAADLLNAYQDLKLQVRAAIPKLFSDIPSADFDIRAADWFTEPAIQLSYQRPGMAGFPPAVLWVHSAKPALRSVSIAGFLQQAEPGHHFQIALQQQRSDLPRFRRFGTEAAFIEGWGLYAALLGEELGVYSDDAAKQDASALEMRCAVALVVDTGIHAKGWTRTQAFDYLHAHLAIDEGDGQSLVDWYAANPADALACKMGELKIRAIRTRAQQLLGSRFDVRNFHSEILKDGAMPVDILEAKMKLWTDARP